MRNAVAYIRVSREREEGASPATQLEKIRQYCKLHDLALLDVFRDLDISGRTDDRPAFRAMIDRVQEGGVDVVLVYKLDRFARSVKDFHRYMAILDKHDCNLVSITQGIDTSTAPGRLMRNILVDFAEFESAMIGERISDNKRHIVRVRGRYLGRYCPFGYQRTKEGLVPDPETAPVVRWIFEQCCQGVGIRRIAKMLTARFPRSPQGRVLWRYSTVWSILRNRIYLGEVRWADAVNPNAHEPIIDSETWERAQQMLSLRRPERSGSGDGRLLSGLLRCGVCGLRGEAKLVSHRGRVHRRWYCTQRVQVGKSRCANVGVDEAGLEDLLVEAVMGLVDEQRTREALQSIKPAEPPDETAHLRRRLERIRATMDRLFEDHYEHGIITREQFIERNARYLEEYQAVQRRLESLGERNAPSELDVRVVQETLVTIRDGWDAMTLAERRLALSQVVREVAWTPQGVTIHWHLGEPTVVPYWEVRRGIGYLDTRHLVRCPDCGAMCRTGAGLWQHRRRCPTKST